MNQQNKAIQQLEEGKKKRVKKWAELTPKEKRAVWIQIFNNTGGYANLKKPFIVKSTNSTNG
jgi:predicted Fe-S protein YdhL (DUF1289 family)